MNMRIFATPPFAVPPRTLARALLLAPALFMAAPVAQAATVTFSNINDSVGVLDGPGFQELFDVTTTVVDGGDPNTLILGLTDFNADGGQILATDTLSFTVSVNDPAYRITSISYSESGVGNGADDGSAFATGAISVNGDSKSLGFHSVPDALSVPWALGPASFPLSGVVQEAVVTITNTLIATGSTDIEKNSASVTVGVAPVPLPPAVWLLGSAILGMVSIGRARRRG